MSSLFDPPTELKPMLLPTWRLCCLLCGRTVEVMHRPFPRRCQACGGYLEARNTREWERC